MQPPTDSACTPAQRCVSELCRECFTQEQYDWVRTMRARLRQVRRLWAMYSYEAIVACGGQDWLWGDDRPMPNPRLDSAW